MFKRNQNKISVRKDWTNLKPEYNEYYQEDCTLIYNYELKCVQTLKTQVPYIIGYGKLGDFTSGVLQSVDVGLYNIILQFKKFRITIPTNLIDNAIKKNEMLFQSIQDDRIVMERLKFAKYKGSTFKKIVNEKNIQQWIPRYCNICGKPVVFSFKDDVITIQNYCTCDCNTVNINKFSYDDFAVWFSCVVDKNILKYYKEFWFK